MRLISLVAFFLVIGPIYGAHAQKRVCGDGPVIVKAVLGQMVDIFIEDGVGDLVRSGDPASLKVEHTSGHLFITPLTRDPAGLVVVDKKGRSHAFKYVFDEGVDEKITVSDCVQGQPDSGQEGQTAGIMRALVLGRTPSGATEKIADAVIFENEDVQLRAVRLYELPQAFGYVMAVTNKTQKPAAVPLQRITFPGLLIIASDEDVLAPGQGTHAYMVLRR